jgi:anion-transporting  ArsA/GET3 family ATPase
VASRELVEEMVTFFRLFASMREGFTRRATEVSELMKHADTAFVLVASADPMHLDDARTMRDGLVERGVAPDAVILNRSFVPEPSTPLDEIRPVDPVHETAEARLERLGDDDAPAELGEVLEALERLRRRLHRRYEHARAASEDLAEGLEKRPLGVILPELNDEVTSMAQLLRLARLF